MTFDQEFQMLDDSRSSRQRRESCLLCRQAVDGGKIAASSLLVLSVNLAGTVFDSFVVFIFQTSLEANA